MIRYFKMVLRKYPDKNLVAVVIHFTPIIIVNPVFQVVPVIEGNSSNSNRPSYPSHSDIGLILRSQSPVSTHSVITDNQVTSFTLVTHPRHSID